MSCKSNPEIDELSDDSSEYDFEKALDGKDIENLDSYDEDFGESSEAGGEEEGEEEQDLQLFEEDKSRGQTTIRRIRLNKKQVLAVQQKGQGAVLDIEKEVGKITTKREEKKKKTVKKETTTVWKPRFIHEVYTQERLLRDAVAQEYLNKYSLVSLGQPDPADQHAGVQEESPPLRQSRREDRRPRGLPLEDRRRQALQQTRRRH